MAVPDYTFKIKDISDSLGSNNVTVDEDDVDNQAQPVENIWSLKGQGHHYFLHINYMSFNHILLHIPNEFANSPWHMISLKKGCEMVTLAMSLLAGQKKASGKAKWDRNRSG